MHFDSWVMDVLVGNQMKIESVEGGKQERAKRGKPKKKEKTEFDEITLLMEELSITEGKKGKRGRQKMLMVNFQDSVFSGYQSEESLSWLLNQFKLAYQNKPIDEQISKLLGLFFDEHQIQAMNEVAHERLNKPLEDDQFFQFRNLIVKLFKQ